MSRSKWIFSYFRRPKLNLRHPKIGIPQELPKKLIGFFIFVMVGCLYAGIPYIIKKEPLPMTSSPLGAPIAITNTLDSQYIVEGIVAPAIIFFGCAGLFLLTMIRDHLDNPRFSAILLLLGLIAFAASYGTLHYMLLSKIPG